MLAVVNHRAFLAPAQAEAQKGAGAFTSGSGGALSTAPIIRWWPDTLQDLRQALPGWAGQPTDIHDRSSLLGPTGHHLHRPGIEPGCGQQRAYPSREDHRSIMSSD